MGINEFEEFAYWIGVVQSDSHFSTYANNRRILLQVSEKSLPMLRRFQILSEKLLTKHAKIYRDKRKRYDFCIGIKGIMPIILSFDIKFGDPPIPPAWTLTKPRYFGAYLAGLIDGDGDVRIKRKKYPQCVIRINSGEEQKRLKNCVNQTMKCSATTTKRYKEKILEGRKIRGNFFELEFYISSKNHKFIKNFVIPNIQLMYKREKIMGFILSKFSSGQSRRPHF